MGPIKVVYEKVLQIEPTLDVLNPRVGRGGEVEGEVLNIVKGVSAFVVLIVNR
jgi:hypothetical protein